MKKAQISLWDDVQRFINEIRATYLKKYNKDIKQSTVINKIIQKFVEEHPEVLKDPKILN